MLRQILVAYADDELGEAALATARGLARTSGARVILAHVVPVVDDDPVDVRTQVAMELLAAREDVRRRQRLVTIAATALPDIDTDVRVLTGAIVEQLLALSHAEHPDLLIAGARRATPMLRFLRRGVAERLIDRAPCPVLVVSSASRGTSGPPGLSAHNHSSGLQRPVRGPSDHVAGRDDDASRSTVVSHRTALPVSGGDDGEPMTSSHLLADSAPPASTMGTQPSRVRSLLWQLFFADAVLLLAALIVLVVSPVRVSTDVVFREVVVLAAGLAILLVVHLLLLRKTLAPLRLLTDVIGTIDPRRPGRRLPIQQAHTTEVAALAEAFNRMLDRLEDERRESSRRALAAQEDERLRIAREMHDQIGQTLTALIIQAENAVDTDEPIRRSTVERVATTASEVLEDVRRIGRELRPEALDDLGLGNALIALCRRTASQGGVRVTHDLDRELPALRSDIELVVYRIAQEALTNALRHAQATRVKLSLRATRDELELAVVDDGTGLPDELPDDTAGLSGMRERTMLIGGRLSLRSTPEGGADVKLSVPLSDAVR